MDLIKTYNLDLEEEDELKEDEKFENSKKQKTSDDVDKSNNFN